MSLPPGALAQGLGLAARLSLLRLLGATRRGQPDDTRCLLCAGRISTSCDGSQAFHVDRETHHPVAT